MLVFFHFYHLSTIDKLWYISTINLKTFVKVQLEKVLVFCSENENSCCNKNHTFLFSLSRVPGNKTKNVKRLKWLTKNLKKNFPFLDERWIELCPCLLTNSFQKNSSSWVQSGSDAIWQHVGWVKNFISFGNKTFPMSHSRCGPKKAQPMNVLAWQSNKTLNWF